MSTRRWRFWLRWVIATNVGFWIGIAIEWWVAGHITNSAVPLGGVRQAWVLHRHVPHAWTWALGSAAGWWVGMAVAGSLMQALAPELPFWASVVTFAGIAGSVVGIPTFWIQSARRPVAPVAGECAGLGRASTGYDHGTFLVAAAVRPSRQVPLGPLTAQPVRAAL